MTRARKLANLGNQNAFTVDSGSLNVGIGSTRPDYKLDVDGTAYVGGGVTISGTLSVGGTVTYEDVTNVDAVGIITANSGVNIVGGGLTVTGVGTFFGNINAESKVGIGTTNPTELLEIVSAAACGIAIKDGDNGFAASKIKVENGGRDLSIGAPQDIIFKDIDTDTNHLYIESGGNVGIGTDNPVTSLHAYHATTNEVARLESGDSTVALSFRDSATTSNRPTIGGKTDDLFIQTGGSEKLRIVSDGKVLLQHYTSRSVGGASNQRLVQIEGTTQNNSSVSLVNNQNNTTAPNINFGKTRGSNTGDSTIVQDGDDLGSIHWTGADGVDLGNATATLKAIVNGSPSENTIPTDITFLTGTTVAGKEERVRITSAGLVGIGTTNPANDLHIMDTSATMKLTSTASATSARLIIESEADSYGGIHFGDPSDEDSGRIRYYHGGTSPDHMQFSTAGTESFRIDSGGNIVFAKTTTEIKTDTDDGNDNHRILISGGGDNSQTRGAQIALYGNEYSSHNGRLQLLAGNAGSANGVIQFYTGGEEKVRISHTGGVGIGTDDPDNTLHIFGASPIIKAQLHKSNTSANQDVFRGVCGPTGDSVFTIRAEDAGDDNSNWILKTNSSENIIFNIGGIVRTTIKSNGGVGIGTTDPQNRLHVATASNSVMFVESYDNNADIIQADTSGSTRIRSAGGEISLYTSGDASSSSAANASNVATFSGSRFAVGMSTSSVPAATDINAGLIQTDGNIDIRYSGTNSDPSGARYLNILNTDDSLVADQPMGGVNWIGNDLANPKQLMGQIIGYSGGNSGGGIHMHFMTGGTRRMILHDNGSFGVITAGESTYNDNTSSSAGLSVNGGSKYTSVARYNGTPFFVNRMSGDGNLIAFYKSGASVGAITVDASGVITYNPFLGAHKGRLSDGSKPTILPGTIVETISQSIEWKTATISNVGSASSTVVIPYYGAKTSGTDTVSYGGASYTGTVGFSSNYQPKGDNKHVCVKVSDTASSKAVGGVFVGWDSNANDAKDNHLDEPYNDLRVGGVGNYFIRMKSGETVAIGDLVESNGDGTGKVQSDDIIRSKTVGKITSTNVIKTYSDGSFLVTAVLYAG